MPLWLGIRKRIQEEEARYLEWYKDGFEDYQWGLRCGVPFIDYEIRNKLSESAKSLIERLENWNHWLSPKRNEGSDDDDFITIIHKW